MKASYVGSSLRVRNSGIETGGRTLAGLLAASLAAFGLLFCFVFLMWGWSRGERYLFVCLFLNGNHWENTGRYADVPFRKHSKCVNFLCRF